jgi:DNA-binding response OmpR family regulator
MNRVLVVDDDPMVTRLVRINLEMEDFEVLEAWDGRAALEVLQGNPPELLLLDIMMPQMDGWELLRRLRSDPELSDLPIILLTARVQDMDVARGWRMGADGYITKPFNPVELAGALRGVLAATLEEREARRRREISKFDNF